MLYIPSERANLLWFSSNTDKRVRTRSIDDMLWEMFIQLERLSWLNKPMVDKVLYVITQTPNYHLRQYDIEGRAYNLCYGDKHDCTPRTALSRLMKQGVIDRRMIERGCYRHYVYFLKA